MTTNKRLAALGLLLSLPTLGACDDFKNDPGVVKSLHGEGTSRPYVVCRAGDTYTEVALTDAVLKQVKVGDTCPTFRGPPSFVLDTPDSRSGR